MLIARESRSSSAPTKIYRILSDHRLWLADVHAAAHHPHCSTSWRRIQELKTRVFCTAPPPCRPRSHRSSIHASSRATSISDSSSSRQSDMEAKRRRRSWLGDLPFDVLVQIAGIIAATSWSPMEDLRALRGTSRFMRRLCRNPEVGRRINLERVSSSNNRWSRRIAYQALLYRLTNVGNPQPCFITRCVPSSLDLCSQHQG